MNVARDDYFYAGTSVLRNLEDIRDHDRLRDFDLASSLARITEAVSRSPVRVKFDRDHLLAIHRRVFGDVYERAGTARVDGAGLRKSGPNPSSIRAGNYAAYDMHQYEYLVSGHSMCSATDRALAALPRPAAGRLPSPDDFARAIATHGAR